LTNSFVYIYSGWPLEKAELLSRALVERERERKAEKVSVFREYQKEDPMMDHEATEREREQRRPVRLR
jgi:hypothetical protein